MTKTMDTTWGTTKRIEAQLSAIDDADMERLVDRVLQMGNAPRFIANFQPQSWWLWRQFRAACAVCCVLWSGCAALSPRNFAQLVSAFGDTRKD